MQEKSSERAEIFKHLRGEHTTVPLCLRVSRLGRLLFRSKHFRSPNPFQWNPATGLHMYVLWSIYHYLSLVLISSKWAPLIFYWQHIDCVYFVCQYTVHRLSSFLFVSTKAVRACQTPEKFLRGGQMEVRKHLGFKQLPQVAQSRIVCVLASLECNVKLIYGRSLHSSDQHSHYTYNTKINSKFWLIMILNKISLDCKLIFNKIIKILGRVWQFRNTKEERLRRFSACGSATSSYLWINILFTYETSFYLGRLRFNALKIVHYDLSLRQMFFNPLSPKHMHHMTHCWFLLNCLYNFLANRLGGIL